MHGKAFWKFDRSTEKQRQNQSCYAAFSPCVAWGALQGSLLAAEHLGSRWCCQGILAAAGRSSCLDSESGRRKHDGAGKGKAWWRQGRRRSCPTPPARTVLGRAAKTWAVETRQRDN